MEPQEQRAGARHCVPPYDPAGLCLRARALTTGSCRHRPLQGTALGRHAPCRSSCSPGQVPGLHAGPLAMKSSTTDWHGKPRSRARCCPQPVATMRRQGSQAALPPAKSRSRATSPLADQQHTQGQRSLQGGSGPHKSARRLPGPLQACGSPLPVEYSAGAGDPRCLICSVRPQARAVGQQCQ